MGQTNKINILGELFKRVTFSLKKDRSVNFIDILTFFGKLVLFFIFYSVSISASRILSSGLPFLEAIRQAVRPSLGTIALLAIFLTASQYLIQLLSDKKKRGKLRDYYLIFKIIGGAIEELIDLRNDGHNERKEYSNKLLRYIEKIVDVELKLEGIPIGDISANLMIKLDNPDRLVLDCWGTRLSGRTNHLMLILDSKEMKPGAPEAYFLKRFTYVDNTQSAKYANYFDKDKPYRSIISFPLKESNEDVFAIVNIDSTLPGQFVSEDVIKLRIYPFIEPLILLQTLERRSLIDYRDEQVRRAQINERQRTALRRKNDV